MKKKKKSGKKILFSILIILLLLAAIAIFIDRDEKAVEQPQQREAVVTSNTYTQVIDISGYVEPYDSQTLRFRSTGAVTAVYVDEGDKVEEGQLLASIDNTSQLASLQDVRNQVEEAELNGSKRELELLRLKETAAENALEYTNIVAPFSGEIASVDVDEGDYFEGGDEVITIVDRSKLKATVEIDEIDMQYVKEGQKAELIFESCPDEVVQAVVSYIPMLGRYSDQGIGVVDVELLIEDPPSLIMPGFTFEGTLEDESEVEMLLIPQSAIKRGRGGLETVNKKMDDGSVETIEIRTSYLGEGLAELLSGNLKEGDVLVYGASQGGM
ncbi:MAG: efflux RND transporter periplasmic adaptor subunit [Spirochaetes bacterium]|uniref:Efflux RND transporter periplasmic adaptor subunit n=1 Tax=Candidatus Ornithospirochaeta stercoripullorum TaxID=2840899 RepID=A0A9D9DZF7_9SPIO|nr:efflux RND transporter periplasmic adaptor subunit [Candidatus Ornithospirochaeta stercoripullorum]